MRANCTGPDITEARLPAIYTTRLCKSRASNDWARILSGNAILFIEKQMIMTTTEHVRHAQCGMIRRCT